MGIPLTDEMVDRLIDVVDEQNRLAKLTNEQLVLECLDSEAADYDVVNEMMTRLHPTWMDLTPQEEAELSRQELTLPASPAVPSVLPGDGLATHTADPASETPADSEG